MNITLLSIFGAVALILLALFVKKGANKDKGEKNSRNRPGRGLILARENIGKKAKSSLWAPLVLGLVIFGLSVWMGASYFLTKDDPRGDLITPNLRANEETTRVLSGRIIQGAEENALNVAPINGQVSSAAQPPAQEIISLFEAAKSMAPDTSRLESVGQQLATPPRPAANRPAAPPATTPRATTAPSVSPSSTTSPPSITGGLLSSSREFTVHLASFGDKNNAEKYKAKLESAGESAYISEITVSDRLWFRVMSGRFPTQSQANSHGLDLKRRDLTTESGTFLVKPINF
ncbi:MAG: SPOR domain-containing protein [Candidatus Adiutrix sp.]